MPVGGQAQPPGGVYVALLVDYDVRLPRAADVLDPVRRGGLVAVGDGYAVDLGVVLYGECGEVAEGLLGDCWCGRGRVVLERFVGSGWRSVGGHNGREGYGRTGTWVNGWMD